MQVPLLSPLFAVLLALGAPAPAVDEGKAQQAKDGAGPLSLSDRAPQWTGFDDIREVPQANQVRIEQRVILRISPQPSSQRRGLLADLPSRPVPMKVVEQRYGKCVTASDIVGVQDRGNRLLMYMRDRKIIAAALEKACSPRDFYLGFYVESNEDGKLCVDRDRLLSRAGAKCRVERLSRLVAVPAED